MPERKKYQTFKISFAFEISIHEFLDINFLWVKPLKKIVKFVWSQWNYQ